VNEQEKLPKKLPENYPIKLVWEDPVKVAGSNPLGAYLPIVAKVRERPGQWARIRVMRHGSAYSTSKRLRDLLRKEDPHWETAIGPVNPPDPNLYDMRSLYLRYRTDDQMPEGGE